MTSPWPSDRPGGRRGTAPKGQLVPTNWASGLVVLWVVLALTAAAVVLWPVAAGMLDAIRDLTVQLDPVTYRKAL